jgi:DNA-binding PadR family transcriptional regulator
MGVSAEMMKGTVVPVTLKLLSEREMYGYEIIKEVNVRTNNVLAWKEATLYPWLHRLEQDGLIQSEWQERAGTRRRKYYTLTRKGAASLAHQTAEWTELSGAVAAILTPMAVA